MPESIYAPASQADIEATFPPAEVHVTGEPNLLSMLLLFRHLVACASAFVSKYNPLGLLYTAVPEGLWPMYTGRPYPATPTDPGEQAVLNPDANNGENAMRRDNWSVLYKYYCEDANMNRGLITRFLSRLDDNITANFKNDILMRNPRMKFLDAFDHFFQIYGLATPTMDEKNRENMRKTWKPHMGMEALIHQIEEGTIFAHFTQNPYSDKQLVSLFMYQVNNAGVYQDYMRMWRNRDDERKTLVHCKDFWRNAHIQWRQDNVGRNFGYGLNAADTGAGQPTDEDHTQEEQDVEEQIEQMEEHAANHAAAMNAMATRLQALEYQNQQQQQMMANMVSNQQQQQQYQQPNQQQNGGRNRNRNRNRNGNRNNNGNSNGANWNGNGWMQGATTFHQGQKCGPLRGGCFWAPFAQTGPYLN